MPQLTKKEIKARIKKNLAGIPRDERLKGIKNAMEQETPRKKAHYLCEFTGSGTPVEILDYTVGKKKRLAKRYTILKWVFTVLTLTCMVLVHTMPVFLFVGIILGLATGFFNAAEPSTYSSAEELQYALEAEQELEKLTLGKESVERKFIVREQRKYEWEKAGTNPFNVFNEEIVDTNHVADRYFKLSIIALVAGIAVFPGLFFETSGAFTILAAILTGMCYSVSYHLRKIRKNLQYALEVENDILLATVKSEKN